MTNLDFQNEFIESKLGKSLGCDICDDLIKHGEIRSWKKESIIFHEHDEATGLYIVIDGVIKLTQYTYDGREVILHLAEPYSIVAEAAVFLGHFPASAVTVTDATLIFIRKEKMFVLMDKYPVFLRRIFDAMAVWLKRLVGKINQLTMNDANARVATYLLNLQKEQEFDGTVSVNQMRLPVKKGELAVMLNMNQSSLSRVFRKFQDDKVIDVRGRDILLNDVKLLYKLSLPELD